MYDLKKNKFAVLEFATAHNFYDKMRGGKTIDKIINLPQEAIIEVAAVKIESGRIQEYFHSYVAIDGYDARDIEFSEFNFNSHFAMAELLIGAPSLAEVVDKVSEFVGDSILIVNSMMQDKLNPFWLFKKGAEKFGKDLNNVVVTKTALYNAVMMQWIVEECDVKFESIPTSQIAQALSYDENWTDIFAEHEVYFDPDNDDPCFKGRNDPLNWALAFARFFVNIARKDLSYFRDEIDESQLTPIDDDLPF